MKRIPGTLTALLLASSLLFIPVLAAAGQVRRKSSLQTREKVKDITSTWVRVAPPNGEFAVRMPGSPKVGTEKLVIGQRPAILQYYGLIQDGTEYAVISVSGLDNKRADLAHILMLNLYSRLVPTSLLDESEKPEAGIKATYQRDTSLNGYIGREYGIEGRNRIGLWRFYGVGKKFYAVAASTTRKDSILVARFLNSFTLGPTAPANIHAEAVQPHLNIGPEGELTALSSTGTWLVILRTFSKAERSRANQSMSQLRSLGYDAHILNTDDYPNLRKGFLAVAMGPHSKSAAESVLNKVRLVAPGSYIKSGW